MRAVSPISQSRSGRSSGSTKPAKHFIVRDIAQLAAMQRF
jgi:hypothetical protein